MPSQETKRKQQPPSKGKATRASGKGAQKFELADVEQVSAANPASCVKSFVVKGKPKLLPFDIVIAGGGMGGVAAAIRAAGSGLRVCLTEETQWLGGQMTAQGVSALDENYLVESSGATLLYQRLREVIRAHYRQLPKAGETAKGDRILNPGDCWVSRLSFEPKVALEKLEQLIQETCSACPPLILRRHKVVKLKLAHGRIRSALAVNLDTGKFVELKAKFFLDATELGDLLPLAKVDYATGAEPRSLTGEEHAPLEANPDNVQDFTYPFVLELRQGEKHVIAKPAQYDKWRDQGKFTLLGYKMFVNAKNPKGGQYLPFWTYRRLISKDKFGGAFNNDVSMINWEANDVRGENLVDQMPETEAERLGLGKNISLGFLYWLQTEAPRDDGGKGYPEFKLSTDVLGTEDGLSKYPYIRESRRIKARRIILEQDIAKAKATGARARLFDDSVGIGLYPIDIHGKQDVQGAGQEASPFQIPLAALVLDEVRNLIPACKNIGTTHITNGAYRLHPVEWAIGEAAGQLAAFCVLFNRTPSKFLMSRQKVRKLQFVLILGGSPVFWYDDVPTNHPNFVAIQMVSVTGLMRGDPSTLSFKPDEPMPAFEADRILTMLGQNPESAPADATRGQFAKFIFEQRA